MPNKSRTFFRASLAFWLGLFLVIAFWYSIHTPGFTFTGYSDDYCIPDILRRTLAENLKRLGNIGFHSDRFFAPFGISMALNSWGLERDWLGAYFWLWNPAFPFHWVYVGVSFLVSYLGVGWILRRMKLRSWPAWGLAALVVIFNLPRHFKAWHHLDFLPQHWVYWSFFLDAWIWQRLWREKRWSLHLELWRGVCLAGTLGISGYFWGPSLYEWAILRASIGAWIWRARMRGDRARIELAARPAWFAFAAGLIIAALDLWWFIPYASEVLSFGKIHQPRGFDTRLSQILTPLWLEPLLSIVRIWIPKLRHVSPISGSETMTSAGWLYWVPVLWGATLLRKTRKGLGLILPFLITALAFLLYMWVWGPGFYKDAIQRLIPTMTYFRVTSRIGLFLPALLGAMIALLFPVLEQELKKRIINRRFRKVAWTFALLSIAELGWIAYPVTAMPVMNAGTTRFLQNIKSSPGEAVLDLPFCINGGSGGCPVGACVGYPAANSQLCFGNFDGKSVYGVYNGRITSEQCAAYAKQPYESWFTAWNQQRCFTDAEFDQFCAYLDSHPELSAVLVYPDFWRAAAEPSCRAAIERRLGAPVDQAEYFSLPTRGGRGSGSFGCFGSTRNARGDRAAQSVEIPMPLTPGLPQDLGLP